MLFLPFLGGGGGGGGTVIDARLFALAGVREGVDMSMLATLGGRPDADLEEPRAGGTGGRGVEDAEGEDTGR